MVRYCYGAILLDLRVGTFLEEEDCSHRTRCAAVRCAAASCGMLRRFAAFCKKPYREATRHIRCKQTFKRQDIV